ncbi:MAG: OsmC family protein [Anaerolineales bacterium]|nr:OsmC family protein [Anaerolineales bacterium]
MNSTTIHDTIRLWQAEPAKAQVKPVVKAHSDGAQAVFEAGSFSWRSDLPPSPGGTNTAPSPTALLLSALAGCAVVFIRDTLAPQLGVRLESVEAVVQCEADFRGALGMEGATPDLQNVQVAIQIQSSDNEENVRKLYQIWQERCPIYLALIKPLPVSTALEIKGT